MYVHISYKLFMLITLTDDVDDSALDSASRD